MLRPSVVLATSQLFELDAPDAQVGYVNPPTGASLSDERNITAEESENENEFVVLPPTDKEGGGNCKSVTVAVANDAQAENLLFVVQ